MKINIRPLQSADHDQWLVLWQGYLDYYRAKLKPEITVATWGKIIDPEIPIYGLCAVDASGDLLGMVHYIFHPVTWAVGERCYLEDLFTNDKARGQGVGHALIEAVNKAAKAKNADQVYWLTEDYNTRAHRLYDHVAVRTPFIKYMQKL